MLDCSFSVINRLVYFPPMGWIFSTNYLNVIDSFEKRFLPDSHKSLVRLKNSFFLLFLFSKQSNTTNEVGREAMLLTFSPASPARRALREKEDTPTLR